MDSDRVTELLAGVRRGEPDAPQRLFDLVHAELRRMAEGKMLAERPGHTLQPTALVNEAFLGLDGAISYLEDRPHFFGAAARAMERVLIDHARRRGARKRGGDAVRVTLSDVDAASPNPQLDALEVHESIEVLERESPQLAELVRYRYFAGMTLEQVAEIEQVSLATIKRRWVFARAWLYERLGH